MHFKTIYNRTASFAKLVNNSEKTRKVLSVSHTFLNITIRSKLARHVVAGVGVGVFLGAIIPFAPMSLALRAGVVLGTYKYLTK